MNLLLAALVLAAACDAKKADDGKPTPAAKTPAAPPVDAAPAVEVTAGKLFEDYARDESAADKLYLSKTLRVRALVHSHGARSVQMEAAGGASHVEAWFVEESAPTVHRLRRGDEVAVLCRGGGMLDVPTLQDCTIERVGDGSVAR